MNTEAKAKRVSDIIGDGSINFYPDYPKIDVGEFLGKEFMLMDAKIMRDWPSDYAKRGLSDWCLMQIQLEGVNYTTKCGGQVLVRRVADLLSRKAFPLLAEVVMQGDAERPYYNIK